MVKAVFFVASAILGFTVTVSGLQCYVCFDCVQIKDEYVQSCDSISPPTNSTTPPPSTSTTVSTTSSTEPSTSSSTSTTTSTTTTTTTTTEASTSSFTTTEASRIDKAEINYECFQGKVNVNGSDVIIRGCAAGRTNETCESFGVTDCTFCGTDKCNAAASIQSSVFVLLSVFIMTLVFKQ